MNTSKWQIEQIELSNFLNNTLGQFSSLWSDLIKYMCLHMNWLLQVVMFVWKHYCIEEVISISRSGSALGDKCIFMFSCQKNIQKIVGSFIMEWKGNLPLFSQKFFRTFCNKLSEIGPPDIIFSVRSGPAFKMVSFRFIQLQ